ncbi:MAG: aminotransferase class III-fold pyridoxal phosphate-dependent enzyme, partial [Actinomycetia bacterium]|nr:aminotransferase class III-fold pyridoxal phosphate-dependent enzyme [Actinomycetes bacterium]
SMQGEAGAIVPPDGYLAAAREAATKHGALLWLDEVQTGIGRTGDWFGYQASGVTPDIVTVAKGLGGGVPIGACIGIGDAGDLLQPGNHGTTFGGNPLATAAGLAVLDTIEKDGLLEHAQALGERVREAVRPLPHVTDVSGRGLLIGIGLDAEIAPAVHDAAMASGLIINACGPARLRLAPPLVLTEGEADRAVEILAGVLKDT